MARSAAYLPGVVRHGRARKLIVAPVIREPVLHRQIADCFRRELAAPARISAQGVVWFSVDIAGYVGSVPGIRTGRGVVAGCPDIVILYMGRAFFLEIKADDGSLSPAQCLVGTALLESGCRWGIARDAKEALACLDQWQIPRRGAMRI